MYGLKLQTMSIGDRIRRRMTDKGLKPKHITKATGASKGTVSQWVNDKSAPSALYITPLCEALGCSVEELIYGEQEKMLGENFSGVRYARGLVPVISKEQAVDFKEKIGELGPGDVEEFLPCPRSHSKYTYALRVEGDFMTSPGARSYEEGVVIYCDPEQAADVVSGDLVIARVKGDKEATFRQYVRDGSRQYLKALNTAYPLITEEFSILAKVIGAWSDV